MHASPHRFHLRRQACRDQGGLCFYCSYPMGKDITAEHLVARKDGGKDKQGNIVAAHYRCNADRHAKYGGMAPDLYATVLALEAAAGLSVRP